jgi:predicted CopG family antitoxin
MQITLDDRQYERLREEAERTGASLAELIRRAVDAKYRQELTLDEKLRAVERTAGLWSEEQAQDWERARDEARERRRRMLDG